MEHLEITPKMAAVLKVFLEDPEQPRYGLELMRHTHQPSGTTYPLLSKLLKAGWLTASKEDIDPRVAGRPARRTYRITGNGVTAARIQLAALSDQFRPPAPVRPRLAPDGGAL
jgi:PadR family transcriptional regulator, regulatory protein PadR